MLVASGFSIFGLNVKFYGIIMALSMLIGIVVAIKNTKYRNLTDNDIYKLALYVLPLSVIGARIVYVIGSSYNYSFLEIFKIWEGGLSIYGGIIGGAVGVVLFCILHKKNFFDIADIAVISLILGQAIGRWGNFFNQEVYGKIITDPSWQWFPFGVLLENGEWHYALFFYESIINLAIFVVLQLLMKKQNKKGLIMALYLICYGTIRLIMEPMRMQEYNLMIFGIKLSSLISVISIITGIVFLILIYTKLKKGNKVEEK